MMGDSGEGQLVDAFKGKTKEGIGMGTKRQEILDAFGEPEPSNSPAASLVAAEEAKSGFERLSYQSGRVTFTLKEGVLVHITLR